MLIIPAIDILDTKLVRLTRGDYNQVTEYGLDPVETLQRYAAAGAKRIHLVFLGAARDGFRLYEEDPILTALVNEKKRLGIEIEVGGGIRTIGEVKSLLEGGVDYAILGTAAILDIIRISEQRLKLEYPRPVGDFLKEVELPEPCIIKGLVENPDYLRRSIISIDCKKTAVAVSGWQVTLPPRPEELVREFQALGFRQIIHTSVDKDGTLSGPDTAELRRLAEAAPEVSFLSAGGIGTLKDIETLRAMQLPNLKGVITGKAIYEGKLNLREAVKQFQPNP